MNALRSILFNFCFFAGSLACSVVLAPALLLPKRTCARVVGDAYGGFILFITKYVMGIDLRMEGLENVPESGAFILASKHQSAYETLTMPFMRRLGYPAIILKKSLSYIPLWGLYTIRMGEIPIDRSAGTQTMRKMSAACKAAVDAGRPVLIFPQGTRVRVGVEVPYKAGLAKLYKDLGVPVVPVALNTGVFWGRNAFFKKPGTITYKFLEPIPAGVPPLQMMARLEKAIEEESERLVRETL